MVRTFAPGVYAGFAKLQAEYTNIVEFYPVLFFLCQGFGYYLKRRRKNVLYVRFGLSGAGGYLSYKVA